MKVGKILGAGFAGWAAWRIFGPEPRPRFPTPQYRGIRVEGRSVFVGDKEFFVREAGPVDAPVVVLIHGWSFDSEMTFHRLIPELADRFRVVVPDLRNHGKSDRVRAKFEVGDVADDIAGIFDALDLRRVTVLGYSMGGMATLELASRRPDLVARVVLASTAAYPVARLRPAVRTLFWLGRSLARISRHEMSLFMAHYLVRRGALDRHHAKWVWQQLMARDATLYYEAGAAIWRFDGRSLAKALRLPAVVVITTGDQLLPPDRQYELAGLVPGARIVELAGEGHEAILTQPKAFVEAIDEVISIGAAGD